MATALKEKINISLGLLIYLAIGAVVAISQNYWDFTNWDDHVLASFLTALMATLFWPVAIFYQFVLIPH
jgi:hypothetical protein